MTGGTRTGLTGSQSAIHDAVGDAFAEDDLDAEVEVETFEEVDDEPDDLRYDREPDELEPDDDPRDQDPPWQLTLAKVVFVLIVVGVVVVEALALADGLHPLSHPRQPVPSALGTPPAELPTVGSYVRSDILESGRIEVSQWIRSATPLESIRLAAHDSPLPVDTPQARSLEVVTGDGRVVVSGGVVGTRPQALDLGRPTRLVRLTYELTGVVDRDSSVSGRALAGVTYLDVDYLPESGPARVLVSGPVVLNLSCADRASVTALRRPCGEPRGSGWQVTLDHADRDDRVAAQLDLG
jgi:hypothetical protein